MGWAAARSWWLGQHCFVTGTNYNGAFQWWDAAEAWAGTPTAISSALNTTQHLHNRSQGPSETYLQICSCAIFRFSLRVQHWNTICFVYFSLGTVGFLSDRCMPHPSHFPIPLLHLPPCTLHRLWPLSKSCDRGRSVSDSLCTLHSFIAEYKRFLLLASPSCKERKQNQTKKSATAKQLNALNPAAGKERGGKGWRGKDWEDGLHWSYFCPVQVDGQRQLNIAFIKAGEQGRWHEPHVSRSKAVSEAHSYFPAQKSPQKTHFDLHVQDSTEHIFSSLQPSLWTYDNVNVEQIGFLCSTCFYSTHIYI